MVDGAPVADSDQAGERLRQPIWRDPGVDDCAFKTAKEDASKNINHIFIGLGSEERPENAKRVADAFNEFGIKTTFFVSEGAAHEWLTWRRRLREFAPIVFNKK